TGEPRTRGIGTPDRGTGAGEASRPRAPWPSAPRRPAGPSRPRSWPGPGSSRAGAWRSPRGSPRRPRGHSPPPQRRAPRAGRGPQPPRGPDRIARQRGGGKGHQRVGPPGISVAGALFPRHHRELFRQAFDGPGQDRALGRWELSFKSEPPPVVEMPPRQEPAGLRVPHVLDCLPDGDVGLSTDTGHGDTPGPRDEVRFGLGRGEPSELNHLVDPELARA